MALIYWSFLSRSLAVPPSISLRSIGIRTPTSTINLIWLNFYQKNSIIISSPKFTSGYSLSRYSKTLP